jgi:transcriptional antiterminator RfaH
MAYWACGRFEPNRERLALHCLKVAGFEVYYPRIWGEQRRVSGSRRLATPGLFPMYFFLRIELQWRAARFAHGVRTLVMDGDRPARLPDRVIDEIKLREGDDGLIRLPKPPQLHQGDQVQIVQGPLAGCFGLVQGMRPGQRVEILLAMLGRVTLSEKDVVTAVSTI